MIDGLPPPGDLCAASDHPGPTLCTEATLSGLPQADFEEIADRLDCTGVAALACTSRRLREMVAVPGVRSRAACRTAVGDAPASICLRVAQSLTIGPPCPTAPASMCHIALVGRGAPALAATYGLMWNAFASLRATHEAGKHLREICRAASDAGARYAALRHLHARRAMADDQVAAALGAIAAMPVTSHAKADRAVSTLDHLELLLGGQTFAGFSHDFRPGLRAYFGLWPLTADAAALGAHPRAQAAAAGDLIARILDDRCEARPAVLRALETVATTGAALWPRQRTADALAELGQRGAARVGWLGVAMATGAENDFDPMSAFAAVDALVMGAHTNAAETAEVAALLRSAAHPVTLAVAAEQCARRVDLTLTDDLVALAQRPRMSSGPSPACAAAAVLGGRLFATPVPDGTVAAVSAIAEQAEDPSARVLAVGMLRRFQPEAWQAHPQSLSVALGRAPAGSPRGDAALHAALLCTKDNPYREEKPSASTQVLLRAFLANPESPAPTRGIALELVKLFGFSHITQVDLLPHLHACALGPSHGALALDAAATALLLEPCRERDHARAAAVMDVALRTESSGVRSVFADAATMLTARPAIEAIGTPIEAAAVIGALMAPDVDVRLAMVGVAALGHFCEARTPGTSPWLLTRRALRLLADTHPNAVVRRLAGAL